METDSTSQETPRPRGAFPESADAVEIAKRRLGLDTPEAETELARIREEMEVAQQVYELRTHAGLSQRELARRIGTTASVISRLENADYDGHSLSMLRRIAAAVGYRVEVRFLPLSASS